MAISDVIWWILFFILLLSLSRLQLFMLRISVDNLLNEMQIYEVFARHNLLATLLKARKDLLEKVPGVTPEEKARYLKTNKEFREIVRRVDKLSETFMISPVSLDPAGIIQKLEHLLRTREKYIKKIVEGMVKVKEEHLKQNVIGALEAYISLHYINKVLRHLYLTARKTGNLYLFMQISMLAPFIRQAVLSVFDTIRAHLVGIPIGDSIGPIVARMLGGSEQIIDEETKMEIFKTTIMDRNVYIIKALGPGSEVGEPGKALEKLINMIGNVSCVITVDAALKYEGEPSGDVAAGIGAAIGDVGPQKWRIEEICTRRGIPYFAVIIKMSLVEALTPLARVLINGAKEAMNRIHEIIEMYTNPGDNVILMGIGNTIGVL